MSYAHPHVTTPVRTYVTVFVMLLVLTGTTIWVAAHDFGALNTPVALAIAALKASLVVFYFMGLRHNTPLTRIVAAAGLFWLLIMFGLTMGDYLSRSWLGVPGR